MALDQNQDVTISISGLLSATGDSMSPTTVEFMTELEPYYSTVERIRIEIGPYITDITDNEIARIIYNYSYRADRLNFLSEEITDTFYRWLVLEYVVCGVIYTLLGIVVPMKDPSRSHQKLLADMQVTLGKATLTVADLANKAKDCVETLEQQIKNGGYEDLFPEYAVKGENDINRPRFGRRWDPTVAPGTLPVGNFTEIIFRRAYKTSDPTNAVDK